jgi:hypothetical protein
MRSYWGEDMLKGNYLIELDFLIGIFIDKLIDGRIEDLFMHLKYLKAEGGQSPLVLFVMLDSFIFFLTYSENL